MNGPGSVSAAGGRCDRRAVSRGLVGVAAIHGPVVWSRRAGRANIPIRTTESRPDLVTIHRLPQYRVLPVRAGAVADDGSWLSAGVVRLFQRIDDILLFFNNKK